MRVINQTLKRVNHAEIIRYIMNGLLATAIHYGVLTFNIEVVEMPSAGLANLVAAIFGITASFLGSRHFVFKKYQEPIINQATMFGILYATIACLHGVVLYVWTDMYKFDYRIGFIIATVLQVMLSYWGNKILVFKA